MMAGSSSLRPPLPTKSLRRDSNPRPAAYKAAALPLSYSGEWVAEGHPLLAISRKLFGARSLLALATLDRGLILAGAIFIMASNAMSKLRIRWASGGKLVADGGGRLPLVVFRPATEAFERSKDLRRESVGDTGAKGCIGAAGKGRQLV
jgi:hypothetical protein